jgi:hypothetical protein
MPGGEETGRAGFLFVFDGAGELSGDPRSDQVQLRRDLVPVLYPPCYERIIGLLRTRRQAKKWCQVGIAPISRGPIGVQLAGRIGAILA